MTGWQNVPHPEHDEDFTGFAAWRDAFWADDPEGFREWLDEKQQQREEIRDEG